MNSEFEWVGAITPSRYVDRVRSSSTEYAFADAGILLIAFLVLLGVATALFVRRDI